MRPGAPPQSRRYIYTGPGGVSSLVTDPPGTPVTPCIGYIEVYIYIYIEEKPQNLNLTSLPKK